ncbi:MAG TPA: patatin-like phospholipase RssA [Sedimenticola sp.]|nr:patatin-like phospholipase RssA [Sedimenticola sp.]
MTRYPAPPEPASGGKLRNRIGLALGSGSARGWAHIGVIRALLEMGIEPAIVSGSSIGSLVGAAYASDQLARLERWVTRLTWKDIVGYLDLSVIGGGIVQGDKLLGFVRRHVPDMEIGQLPRRFGAVATDLENGREVWFQHGPLLDAIRASIALPGLFTPVRHNDRWLVDGGLVDPVPVSLCRAMGAEIVIAVNLNGDIVGKHRRGRTRRNNSGRALPGSGQSAIWEKLPQQLKNNLQERSNELLTRLLGGSNDTPGIFEVMAGSINIMQDRITRSRMAGDPPEVLLSPRLAHLGLMEFHQARPAIEEGYACVGRMHDELERLLASTPP